MPYVQGFVLAVPAENKAKYIASAEHAWGLFRDYGALEMKENWGIDTPEGETTSFPMAVKRAPDEIVVFSWLIWPDKATAEACFATMDTDPRWTKMADLPFDGKRMIWGAFEPIFEAHA